MREFFHKLVSFFSNVAEGGPTAEVSQAALKCKLDTLSSENFQIDLRIQ